MLGESGADRRACPRKVLVFPHLDGICNGFRRLRGLGKFTMRRISSVEPGDRQVEHIFVEIPCPPYTPLPPSLQLFDAGP